MSKYLKIYIAIITILLILIVGFFVRNIFIFKNIQDNHIAMVQKLQELNNFYYEENLNQKLGNLDVNIKTQIYCKDGIYKGIVYANNEISSLLYFNTKTNEQKYYSYEDGTLKPVDEEIKKENFFEAIKYTPFAYGEMDFKTMLNVITKNGLLARLIKSTKDQYIISDYGGKGNIYVNKENGMFTKWELPGANKTYSLTENIVTDENLEITEV